MRFSLLLIFTLLSILLNAQAPALIPYQAVARDAAGQALNNATINARFTIHDGAATGAAVWQEIQTVTTSALGLFTVQLGSSVPLTVVNWANGNKFMQVEIDLGQGFVDMGTQQMLSVPYALHAGSVSLNVSAIGDTLFVGDGQFVIVPGISEANSYTTGTTLHTCGAPNVHNPDLTYGSMTDQEGNVYKTIVIGTQEWMAENLNTSIYRNGDEISSLYTDYEFADAWVATTAGAWAIPLSYEYCPYGKLYNWYACVDARELCPIGWHVPSDSDWTILISFLDPNFDGQQLTSASGGFMKSVGTSWWDADNTGATNSSGFSAIPAGGVVGGNYIDSGQISWWWSSDGDLGFASSLYIEYNNSEVRRFGNLTDYGLSVRCLRD